MTIVYSGLIFPDVVQALIDSNYIESYADAALQLERTFNPDTTGDADRFRELGKIQKMFKGEGVVPAKHSKKILYKFSEILKPHIDFPIRIELSDYRIPGGDYKLVKAFFLGHNIETTSDEDQALLAHVLALCEEEKKVLKNFDFENIPEFIRCKFYLSDDSLETELHNIFPELNSFEDQKESLSEIVTLVIKTHQYLHLLAILEHHLVITHGKIFTQLQLRERKLITRLLPSTDSKGRYSGSVKKLLISIHEGLGFTSQSKFSESLCREGIDEQFSIIRRLNRWKSGKSRITPKELNKLFQRKNDAHIPDELIIVASLIDITARELMKVGLSEQWVIYELQKYKLYQRDIIKKLGTPYLNSK